MLGQATAMFVSLSTLIALQIIAINLLAIFHEVLSFASSSHTRLLEISFFVVIHFIILVILDRALSSLRFTACSQSNLVAWQTRWW
jgi:hypothetical protein